MEIFKNKSVIRLYAFLTACIILITLLLSGIDCFASGSLSTEYDFGDGYIDSDEDIQSIDKIENASTPGYIMDCWDVVLSNGLPYNNSINPVFDTYILMSYRSVGEPENGAYFGVFPCTSDTIIFSQNSSLGSKALIPYDTLVEAGVNQSNSYCYYYCYYAGGYYNSHQEYNALGGMDQNDLITIDGTKYVSLNINEYWAGLGQGWGQNGKPYIQYTTLPIYEFEGSDFDTLNNSSLSDYTQSNPEYSASSGANSTNFMYFNDFNISYSVSGLYSGNVVCYGTLNDYQKEHLDEFALTYTFNFDYSFYVPTVGGWTSTFSKNYSYQQTLSDFYNNSSSKTFSLKDIMQNINTQDVNSEYGNLYQLITHYANQGTDLNSVEVNWTKAKMKTTVFIVSANDSPSDILNSSDLHSNSFSKAYNFLDGKSSTYSDGITSNNNPYQTSDSGSIENENQLNNMPDGVSSSNIPSSQADNGGSGTSVVTGDNNIVINNNPTFTNNGGSGSGGGSSDGGVASTFYNTFNPFKTLFSSLNGDNSVISDDTAETIGSNRFISVMSSTFSFIPEGMWTALTTFFIASLSILVVAVVIRVLLDLL